MKCRMHCFLQVFLVALFAAAAAQRSAPQVKFAGSIEAPSARAGRSVRVVFETTLPSGFHVNSNKPSDEFLRPTSLSLDTPAGVSVVSIEYPDAHPFKAKFSEEPLAVYEQSFNIKTDLEVSDNLAPGSYPLKATLTYQVCSATVCYPPATRETQVSLALAAAPADSSAKVARSSDSSSETRAEATIRSEDTIESLRVPLAALSKSVANLRLPDERASFPIER